MPPAAPKYPMYTATAKTASRADQPCSRPGAWPALTGPPAGSACAPAGPAGAGGRRIATDPAAISTGAAYSNVADGVVSSSAAPTPPPTAVSRPSRSTRRPWPASSGRDPAAAPSPVNISATVFVTFAATGGRPRASSAG
jgi:hypothetical protein